METDPDIPPMMIYEEWPGHEYYLVSHRNPLLVGRIIYQQSSGVVFTCWPYEDWTLMEEKIREAHYRSFNSFYLQTLGNPADAERTSITFLLTPSFTPPSYLIQKDGHNPAFIFEPLAQRLWTLDYQEGQEFIISLCPDVSGSGPIDYPTAQAGVSTYYSQYLMKVCSSTWD
jgi:hypothetical protein